MEIFEQTKNLLCDSYKDYRETHTFSECSLFYLNSNENIKGYLDLINFENKKDALTVLGSGDHTLNLIQKGIIDIDTFDINALTEYYFFGIKYPMVLKYSYQEYLKHMKFITSVFYNPKSLEKLIEFIKGLFPYMDYKYRAFWNNLLDYCYLNYKTNKDFQNPFILLSININICLKAGNSYLQSEEEYNELKSRLSKANISFEQKDLITDQNFKKQYDIVLLSNVLDYASYNKAFGDAWKLENHKQFIKNIKKLVARKGVLALNYIFMYYDDCSLIDGSNVYAEDLPSFEVIPIENLKKSKAAIVLNRNRS